jgi:cytosine/adenosine deaminase-related metal-dependent hydrolase
VLADSGVLETNLTVVHATHLAPGDISLLGSAGVTVAVCPTTERWLADGIGPTGRLSRAGARLRIGSDSQAVIDPFEETRLLELHQRLLTNTMGTHLPGELLAAGTAQARLAAGFPADLVTVDEGSPRNRGVEPSGFVFTATAADVLAVVVGGRRVR